MYGAFYLNGRQLTRPIIPKHTTKSTALRQWDNQQIIPPIYPTYLVYNNNRVCRLSNFVVGLAISASMKRQNDTIIVADMSYIAVAFVRSVVAGRITLYFTAVGENHNTNNYRTYQNSRRPKYLVSQNLFRNKASCSDLIGVHFHNTWYCCTSYNVYVEHLVNITQ